jgi:signal-transduction protein with cAMP-binding, CBS, and nucleotidyltransferase domain
MLSDTVDKILSEKCANVYSVTPDQPAIDAMALMGQRGIAAVLVVSEGRPVGMVSAKRLWQARRPVDTRSKAYRHSGATIHATLKQRDNITICQLQGLSFRATNATSFLVCSRTPCPGLQ